VSATLNGSVTTILLDVEGTTTPIDFVYQILFPYARSHAGEFLMRHRSSPDVRLDLDALYREHAEDTRQGLNPPTLQKPEEPKSLVPYVDWLIERDRKSTSLKLLQGKIWAEGYMSGELRSRVFDDVPSAFKRWQQRGKMIAIFSSGSVLGQKLLFAHTMAGDLTGYLSAYFDTTVGAKPDPASYKKIASTLQRSPSEVVFISDVVRELVAADIAGFQTLLCERPGNPSQPSNPHNVIRTFEEVFPEKQAARKLPIGNR
jgi:enolase-phosphatase E1